MCWGAVNCRGVPVGVSDDEPPEPLGAKVVDDECPLPRVSATARTMPTATTTTAPTMTNGRLLPAGAREG
jgi:hypothetical protein